MQITNKKLAFYVSLIAMTAIIGLIISGHISNEQAALIIPPLLLISGVFMGLDALYDYLNIAFRIGEKVVALTPSTEDDKKLADLKATIAQLQLGADDKAIGGMVLEWLDKNWKLLPELFIPRGELEKTDEAVTTTTTTTVSQPPTQLAGTNHVFYAPVDETDKGNG